MKIILPVLFLLFAFAACKKNEEPLLTDIFQEFGVDKKVALADGSTLIRVFCKINKDATADRREIRFSISSGQFISNNDSVFIQKSQFVGKELVAEAYFRVPQSGENIRVTAQPNLPGTAHNSYIRYETVALQPSVPATLDLQASSSSIASNFEQEILLTAKLNSASKGRVSAGYQVVFEDELLGGAPFDGVFRAVAGKVNSEGIASAYYAIGAAPIGARLSIKCSLLDDLGNKTIPMDSFTLLINK